MQFYPNIALFSTLGGMNLDHNFFQVSKLSEDQKKRSPPKVEHFFPRIQVKTKKLKKVFTKKGALFSPNSRGDLRSDAHQSQIIGGDANVDHTQIIGRVTVKLLGDISSPSPPGGFGTPGFNCVQNVRFCFLVVLIAGWREHGRLHLYSKYIVGYLIVMILFLSCYNVSLRFSCASFFWCQRCDLAFKIKLRKKERKKTAE